MPGAKSNDLLLDSNKSLVSIVTHADVLFHGIIHFCRNMYRAAGVECKTLADFLSILSICLHSFPWRRHHRRRRKNNAVDLMATELVIERTSQAASFIAT